MRNCFIWKIPNAIDQLQSDNCSIAEATEIWIKLGENLELQNFEQIVKERIQMAITRYHLLANMMHPKYFGKICHLSNG